MEQRKSGQQRPGETGMTLAGGQGVTPADIAHAWLLAHVGK